MAALALLAKLAETDGPLKDQALGPRAGSAEPLQAGWSSGRWVSDRGAAETHPIAPIS